MQSFREGLRVGQNYACCRAVNMAREAG